MRKRNPNWKDRMSMLQNYGHVHNYALYVQTTYSSNARGMVRIYKCSMCEATTQQKV